MCRVLHQTLLYLRVKYRPLWSRTSVDAKPEYKPATVELLLLITLEHPTLYGAQEIVNAIEINDTDTGQ